MSAVVLLREVLFLVRELVVSWESWVFILTELGFFFLWASLVLFIWESWVFLPLSGLSFFSLERIEFLFFLQGELSFPCETFFWERLRVEFYLWGCRVSFSTEPIFQDNCCFPIFYLFIIFRQFLSFFMGRSNFVERVEFLLAERVRLSLWIELTLFCGLSFGLFSAKFFFWERVEFSLERVGFVLSLEKNSVCLSLVVFCRERVEIIPFVETVDFFFTEVVFCLVCNESWFFVFVTDGVAFFFFLGIVFLRLESLSCLSSERVWFFN